jgi:hypothetical protein
VYPRLVRDFYGHLEVIQDDESGIMLQTTIRGHTIQINPQLMSSIIDVPVRAILASPFSEILERPSLEHILDFFDAHPQCDERAHSHIKIDAFSPPLAKIVLHNLWPTARRSELVLKRARFLYALVMRMPFCLCKHILQIMLEMRDEHATSLPFAYLATKIYLRSVTDIAETMPKVRVQDALGS